MKLGGLQKQTLIDYPNKLACTVFTIGCNFRCPFCYNSELVLPKKIAPLHADSPLENISTRSCAHRRAGGGESDGGCSKVKYDELETLFFAFLAERKKFLDAVVICGGEPTIHADLPNFIKKIKTLGYLVKLDTNGSNPKMLDSLLKNKLINYVAMDIKAPKEKYATLVGAKIAIENIEHSIAILKQNNIDHEFRTTIVPTLLNKNDIVKIAEWISPVKKYYLQNFQPKPTINPKLEKVEPYSKEYLENIKNEIKHHFEICEVRA